MGRRRNKQTRTAMPTSRPPSKSTRIAHLHAMADATLAAQQVAEAERKKKEEPVAAPFNRFRCAYVYEEPKEEGTRPKIGMIKGTFHLDLFVQRSKEFFKHPKDGGETILYKGELFNEIMHQLDSSWPYTGADFAVAYEDTHLAAERHRRANVPSAKWVNPSVWPWMVYGLAEQLGMVVNLLNCKRLKE